LVGKAIHDYNMIADGDRIMVCLSGGKDSHTLLDLLLNLQRKAPVKFDILAVNLDQKQPGFPSTCATRVFGIFGGSVSDCGRGHVQYCATGDSLKGKTMCGLCSRLRRGILYRVASEEGATKIALGHHRDDIVETLFLNMFYGRQLKAMPPKLLSDDGKHVVIRPLAYCSEQDIGDYATAKQFPIIPCKLCGSQENLQRVQIKKLLQDWEEEYPGRTESLFHSIQNVTPSHLADTQLFDFANLDAQYVDELEFRQVKSILLY
jgi:tRNA 2-thiocytidine biosynthesis protein TtcA